MQNFQAAMFDSNATIKVIMILSLALAWILFIYFKLAEREADARHAIAERGRTDKAPSRGKHKQRRSLSGAD
jgi:hypothetical protein